MRICIIQNLYEPYDRGGAEQVVKKSIEGLLAAGHEVYLLTATPHQDEEVVEHGLHIRRHHPRNIYFYTDAHNHNPFVRLAWHLVGMFNRETATWVATQLHDIQPDVVHTHNLMGLSFQIPRAVRRLGYRHVHTCHDVQLVEPSAMIMKGQERSLRYYGPHIWVYMRLMRRIFGSPDLVLSPSHFLLRFYKNRKFFTQSRGEVLRNPVTFSFPAPVKPAVTSNKLRIVYVGQIEHHKGIDFFLEALSTYDRRDEVVLDIAGNGSQLEDLKSIFASEQITFHGRLGREALLHLFLQGDITTIPSLCYENSPTVMLESFYCSTPVLASNIEGIAELIEEKKTGLIFEAGDSAALHASLDWLLDNLVTVRSMGRDSLATLDGLALEDHVKRLEELYRL